MKQLLVLIFVNFLWATQFPASRLAAVELRPLTLTCCAMFLAMLALLPVVPSERRAARSRNARRPSRGKLAASVIALGLAGSLVAQLCLNWGLEHAPAANAAVINLTTPVLITLCAAWLLGERMTLFRWFAFALSLAGVILVSLPDLRGMDFRNTQFAGGNLLVFVSCAGSAFYNVYSKRVLDWIGPAELLVASFAVSILAMIPAVLVLEPGAPARLAAITTPSLVSVVIIGVFSLALSMLLFFRVLQNIEATQASLSIYLLPVFGVILSAATLGEAVKPGLIGGGLLVAAGAWLVTAYEDRQKRNEISTVRQHG